ncbi:MAG: hypothetical protein ACK5RL_01815 [Acidimicrobiales bacterium]
MVSISRRFGVHRMTVWTASSIGRCTVPVTGRAGQPLLQAWQRGPRTLRVFFTHGFPNLFQLGAIQNANSVNFAHILQEQARHVTAIIARAQAEVALAVEPTVEAEQAWLQTIADTARDVSAFPSECTPGYYNAEGTQAITGLTYSPSPVAFHRLLERWREGDMSDVLVRAEGDTRARVFAAHGAS